MRLGLKRYLGLLAVSVVAAFSMGAPAAQAASWSVQSTPNPLSVAPGGLRGVSCSSASACTAVGYYNNSTGTPVTLAETWNGSNWRVQSTPNPGGAKQSRLTGVSCSSASACTAVGYYFDSAGTQVTLAEAWSGASWKIESTPNPAGVESSQLAGVSCSSATACTAVGYATNRSGDSVTLAEAWNGSSWSIESTVNPGGALLSSLTGVSCSSASACTAVGNYDNNLHTTVTLAERWDGASWKIESTPNPSGAKSSQLTEVSCSSATACTAVGYYTGAAGTYSTLAEAWNGKTWTIESTPNPTGAKSSQLTGVSCSSASACIAVGYYGNSAGMFAESWNGSSWKLESTPNPTGARDSSLSGVSCSSPSACTAVGEYGNSADEPVTLAETWNGSSWLVQSTPDPSRFRNSLLFGVSCPSSSACTAAGAYTNNAGANVTLAEAWNGTSWKVESTPNPSGAESSTLTGVSCASSSACTAAGAYTNSAGIAVTLAEAGNGSSWQVQSTPNPSGATGSSLSAVSCTAPSACTAVGSYEGAAHIDVTLAEAWDGKSWKIESTPNPSGAESSQLNGVSCLSATACTAVGYYEDSAGIQVTLAELWNGSSWKIESTPHPSGAKSSGLSGVSCTSASACTAVGFYESAARTDVTLAEVWNGSSWQVQSTPNPTGAAFSILEGASCTVASVCTAVGYFGNSSGDSVTLAEVWSGSSWQVQSTPNPAGDKSSLLTGVSCTSASACTAAGSSDNGFISVTLAERYS